MKKLALALIFVFASIPAFGQATYLIMSQDFSDIGAVTQTGSSFDVTDMRQDFRAFVSAYASGQVDTTGLRVFVDFSPNNVDWKSSSTSVIDSLGNASVAIDTLVTAVENDLKGSRYARFRVVPLLGNDATVDVKLFLKVPRQGGVRY